MDICKHCRLRILQGHIICMVEPDPLAPWDTPVEYLHHGVCCEEYKENKSNIIKGEN